MSVLQATYFDGASSRRHPVSVIIANGKLTIVGKDVNTVCDAKRVRRSLRVADTPRWLYLPGGGACVTTDNDAVDRMTRDRRYERILHVWESRPAYAAVAIMLVAAAMWLLVDRALPLAVFHIAQHIPLEAEAALGRQTLSSLENYVLKPSNLSAKRQDRLRARLGAMAGAAKETTPYKLEFRSSPVIGPNAFALPSGIIVVTDELVKLAANDQEILGVLAHELGHVRHRHTMRQLLEGSLTALIIAGITGDIASASSLAASAPALLLQTKYSRDNEREADTYAINLMRVSDYNPGHLAAILARMEAKTPGRGGLPGFLSTHPPTAEREALALAGAVAAAPPEDIVLEEDDTPMTSLASVQTLVPDKPKLAVIDPEQRQIVTLLERRDFEELERVLGNHQRAFENDSGTSTRLEKAFRTFRDVPRVAEDNFNDWARTNPNSYVALMARASFYYYQGLEARGTDYIGKTPEENIRTMRAFLAKSRADLQRSLALTPKPYLSHATLMSIAGTTGDGSEKKHYLDAVKLAPQSVELRLTHMARLEPRWGGSLGEMEEFLKESRSQLADPKAADRLAARIPAYRAFEQQQSKNFAQALKFYNEAISLDPAAGTLCNRAYVLGELKRDAEAFADVRQALAKSRDHSYCMDQAVWLAPRAGDANEAIALMSLVIEVDQNRNHAYNQRGWRYQQQARQELAYQDYLASARLGDGWGQLMTGKYLWSGLGVKANRDEALIWLRKADAQGHPDAKLSLKQALEQLEKK